MNPMIFREYDIRGIVGTDLTPDVIYQLGRGFASYFRRRQARTISVGRDGRNSSPEVRDQLVRGMLEGGVNVVDLGIIPTPLSYYSTHVLKIDGAVMITGSHNPPDYNGFKITLGKEAIFGEQIGAIYELVERREFSDGAGEYSRHDLIPAYIADVAGRLRPKRPVRFVCDAGNGVGGLTAAGVFHQIGAKVRMIFADVDGAFPNHHPDPTVEQNLEALKGEVIKGEYELGIAFDGDADRIGVVDEQGKVIWGDQILAILARDVLREVPGATIIGEVKCSQLLYDDIMAHGGDPIMWKVGHSLIKAKMHETGAQLAGEMSGHIFFSHRYYGFDDAVFVAGRLLEIVARSNRPVSRLLEDWPKLFNTPEIRLDCTDEIKFAVVNKVKEQLSLKYSVIDVDGVRVNMPGGWGLLRASNTQPVVVMRFEAQSQSRLDEIRTEVTAAFQAAKSDRS